MKLDGKIALVTGGAQGIGAATVRKLAAEGAAVGIADISAEGTAQLAEELQAAGAKAIGISMDVSDADSVKAGIARVREELGGIHILINNAGINRDAFAKKMSVDQWDMVLNVNLKGTFLCCQAVIEPFAEQKYGKIVNTASVAALGNMGQANYSASKAGVIGLTKTLALELARDNVNVNCIAPGATETPMFMGVPEEIREKVRHSIPLRRFAKPEDMANLHAFLVSEDASYLTGQVVFCDGGASVGI